MADRTSTHGSVRGTVELRRTVRLCVNPGDTPDRVAKGDNGFGGTPAMTGLGRYYEFEVSAAGVPDAETGYLVDIKTVDRAVRSAVYPKLVSACLDEPTADPGALLARWVGPLAEALSPVTLRAVRWALTPTYSVAMEGLDMTATTDSPARVLIRQKFDFAAAHRLHVDGLSEEHNRELFGKCNNPSGHGHNYRVEPCVAVPVRADGRPPLGLAEIERLTEEAVISRFDHTNLNVDTDEFGRTGVNPSVENIARVAFERLGPRIAEAGGELVSITVWETDRTCCSYPG